MLLDIKALLKNKQNMDSAEHLAEMIRCQEQVFFTSDGLFSTHDLLEALLKHFCPANLYLSTYSITEFPARIISSLQDANKVNELHMLLDREFPRRYPKVDQFLQELCTTIGYTAVHAKIMVLETPKESLMVMGSANWTVNPRLEAGVITKIPGVVADFKHKIISYINGTQ